MLSIKVHLHPCGWTVSIEYNYLIVKSTTFIQGTNCSIIGADSGVRRNVLINKTDLPGRRYNTNASVCIHFE